MYVIIVRHEVHHADNGEQLFHIFDSLQPPPIL